MKVAIVASSLFELKAACSVAISKLTADGHEVHAIIVNKTPVSVASAKKVPQNTSFDNVGVSQIHFVDGFDYSSITQANADKISACIKVISPLVVIMPHWKSSNYDHMILARTTLIACRGIGSILMYEINDNANFAPTIMFSSKGGSGIQAYVDNVERYESHRLLLLDEAEMV